MTYTVALHQLAAQSSVLQSGQWYKLAVKQNGVYRITRSQFIKMGFSGNTDPRKIRIFGYPAGMLPQSNAAVRAEDLTELSIYVKGEEDGIFHNDDAIYFYAEGPDRQWFDTEREVFGYEKNIYSDKNYLFITVGSTHGKRISSLSGLPGSHPVITTYDHFIYHETDQHNELKSGRVWFGEKFDLTTELTFRFSFPGIVSGSEIKLISEVMAQSFQPTSFNLFINNQPIGLQALGAIPNDRYGVKGQINRDTFHIPEPLVNAASANELQLRYNYQKSSSGRSVGYLNFFLLQARQHLRFTGGQLIFRSAESTQHNVSNFRIENTSAQLHIWNITHPFDAARQEALFNAGTTSFSASSETLQTYIIFQSDAPAPEFVGAISNQNLRNLPAANLIIITHPDFLAEANRLANHRRSVSGWAVNVATTTQVYNEFSGGRPDITALRDFVKHQYDKEPGTLRALLLFGKSSYDYRDILPNNRNFVPTYQSRNSLHPLLTYSSDDYFGFLESHEGEWSEAPAVNHTMDIAVGRLPVKSVTEAKQVVDKIIAYETHVDLNRSWRKTIAFVADDGDENLHVTHADILAQTIESNFAYADVRKLYLDAFPQQSGAAGQTSPQARQELERLFQDGAYIINYSGHGSERQWAQERLLDELLISSLQNRRLPILVTATCEFGRQDDPMFSSGAEMLLLKPQGGAIALVSTSRPVFASNNFFLNQAFYNALFTSAPVFLGEVFRLTKNNSLSGVANRNFSLIGDPSLLVLMPKNQIVITSVATQNNSDTLRALSRVTVTGEIRKIDNTLNTSFNGIVQLTLFDKAIQRSTLGNENPPFAYQEYQSRLFRGQATVQSGQFAVDFIVPRSMNYAVGNGRLSAYAFTEDAHQNASGYRKDFKVGLSETSYLPDNTPPLIQVFIGDTTFVDGGVVPPNTRLIIKLRDESGISPSGFGIGNTLSASLDDLETFNLANYYEAALNDYKRGMVDFPLINLAPGRHRITVKAWDVHNNPASASINFWVGTGPLQILEFGNYPNPFRQSTKIYFTHNRSGDDLEVYLELYSPTSGIILRKMLYINESSFRVELPDFEPEHPNENMVPGIYVARLVARSLTNGSKNEQVTRLIYLK
ncbi:MAG: type IX secretion system sortase PorU [Cyclobacteriaceae bacterium]|nr:type IX secretion system sortase PorU [Cyclobacteriaceae bacterium]